MEPPVSELGTDELLKYWQELGKLRSVESDRLNQLTVYRAECGRVLEQLQQLPQKLQHAVMVPCGTHAFFPGHLYHTNELLVDIGSDYRVQCTAPQATAILERRCAFLDKAIEQLQRQVQALAGKQAAATQQSYEEPLEIRHTEEESNAMLASVQSRRPPPPTPTTSDAAKREFEAKLKELARQEEEAERLEALRSDAASPPGHLHLAAEGAETQTDSDDGDEPPAAFGGLPSAFQAVDLDDLLDDDPPAPPQPPSAPPAATHPAARPQPQPQLHKPKSILKKGFLLSSPAPSASSSTQSTRAPLAPKHQASPSDPTASAQDSKPENMQSLKREEAFTGEVLERIAADSAAETIGVSEGPSAAAAGATFRTPAADADAGAAGAAGARPAAWDGNSLGSYPGAWGGAEVGGYARAADAGPAADAWEQQQPQQQQQAPAKKLSKFKQRALGML